jgi:hypothetical protein
MENTLNGEISTTSVYISVLDSFYLHYMGWFKPKNHITLLSL